MNSSYRLVTAIELRSYRGELQSLADAGLAEWPQPSVEAAGLIRQISQCVSTFREELESVIAEAGFFSRMGMKAGLKQADMTQQNLAG